MPNFGIFKLWKWKLAATIKDELIIPFMRGLELLEACQYRVSSKCGLWHGARKIIIFTHFKTLLFMNHLLQQNHWSSKTLPRAEPGSEENKALMATAAPLSGEKRNLDGLQTRCCRRGFWSLLDALPPPWWRPFKKKTQNNQEHEKSPQNIGAQVSCQV